MIAAVLLMLVGGYLACGFVFAVLFVLFGVQRIDPHAAHGSWGFRCLIFLAQRPSGPGCSAAGSREFTRRRKKAMRIVARRNQNHDPPIASISSACDFYLLGFFYRWRSPWALWRANPYPRLICCRMPAPPPPRNLNRRCGNAGICSPNHACSFACCGNRLEPAGSPPDFPHPKTLSGPICSSIGLPAARASRMPCRIMPLYSGRSAPRPCRSRIKSWRPAAKWCCSVWRTASSWMSPGQSVSGMQ